MSIIIERALLIVANTQNTQNSNKREVFGISSPFIVRLSRGEKFYEKWCPYRRKWILSVIAPFCIEEVYVDLEENSEEEGEDDTWTVPGHESRPWIVGV